MSKLSKFRQKKFDKILIGIPGLDRIKKPKDAVKFYTASLQSLDPLMMFSEWFTLLNLQKNQGIHITS